MQKAEILSAPWLGGWVLGAAAGLMAFGVAVVVGGFGLFPAAAIGVVVAALVGIFLGMRRATSAAPPAVAVKMETAPAPGVEPIADAAPVADISAASLLAVPKTQPAARTRAKAPAASAVKAAKMPVAVVSDAVEKLPKVAAPRAKVVKPDGPVRLKAARKGEADDLKVIEGVGPAMEKLVNGLGFYHFDQIAGWSDADVSWVDGNMKTFKGRITRDKWVAQAKIIVSEGLETFLQRAKTNNY